MSSQLLIPPPRDLPAGRLFERKRHLRAEIGGGRMAHRPSARFVAVVALAVIALGILLTTPAFGLRDQVFHFFTGERHPPEVIVKRFENLTLAQPGPVPQVKAGKARNVMNAELPGYGKWSVWVAPTQSGGFCTSHGLCDPHHSVPLAAVVAVAGPSPKVSAAQNSGKETVIVDGFTDLPGVRVAMQFEDGSSERIPLVRVTQPIDAGFFVYKLPKRHWKLGARPVTLVAQGPAGEVLARSTKFARDFRRTQRLGIATPAEAVESSRRIWAFVAVAAGLLAFAAALVWRRRGLAQALPLLVLASLTAVFAGVGIARGGGYHAPSRPEPPPYHPPPTYHAYASGYVREGFLGSREARDRFLIARTPAQGSRWDRWITHHRVSPPQSADFTRQALVGVFLLGRPSDAVQGVAVTKMRLRGGTLRLKLVVSPRPIDSCGPGPDAPVECQPFYKPHNETYHAFTIVAIPKARAARVRRIVVVAQRRDPNPLQVAVPWVQ
jgi:hypothetical protein